MKLAKMMSIISVQFGQILLQFVDVLVVVVVIENLLDLLRLVLASGHKYLFISFEVELVVFHRPYPLSSTHLQLQNFVSQVNFYSLF